MVEFDIEGCVVVVVEFWVGECGFGCEDVLGVGDCVWVGVGYWSGWWDVWWLCVWWRVVCEVVVDVVVEGGCEFVGLFECGCGEYCL